jgi:serine/threonine-protein kinase
VNDVPIGKGGMGTVYIGHDNLGNKVAIKAMHPQLTNDADMMRRFQQEVDILSQLDHPSIVKMLGSFSENGNIYMVMEFVEGQPLNSYVEQHGPLPEAEAVGYLRQVLSGLQYAHVRGFVHRDIKPNNIMIDKDKAKLLDFGIAKNTHGKRLTLRQAVIGTDGYMSPEQAEGYDVDRRSDIYSLGLVLFYMLIGHNAIPKGSDIEMLTAVLSGQIPRVKDLRPELSDYIQSVLDKALEKNMMNRFQSCDEFLMALGERPFSPGGAGGSTVVKLSPTNKVISVGREGCDINIYDPGCSVSRHHADITIRTEPEGEKWTFTDLSSNGSLINGKLVHNESVSFWHTYQNQTFELPTIFLTDERFPLDMTHVFPLLDGTVPVQPIIEPVTNDVKPEVPVAPVAESPTAEPVEPVHAASQGLGNQALLYILLGVCGFVIIVLLLIILLR